MPVAQAEVKPLAVEPLPIATTSASIVNEPCEDALTCTDLMLQNRKDNVNTSGDAINATLLAHIAAAYKTPCSAMSLHPDVLHTITANVKHTITIDCSAQGDIYPPVTSHYIPTQGEVMQTDLSGQHAFIYPTSENVLPILQHYRACKLYDSQHTSALFVITPHA